MDFKGSFERLLHNPVLIMMSDESLSVLGLQLTILDYEMAGPVGSLCLQNTQRRELWGLERFDRVER